MNTMHERLCFLRDSVGLTQQNIAKRIGISYRTWQDYEAAKSSPNSKTLEQLARMGFNVNWILTGEGPIKLSEGKKAKLSYEDAHRFIRKKLKEKSNSWFCLTGYVPERHYVVITEEQLRSYVFDEGYLPTNEQLIEFLKILHLKKDKENELAKLLFDTDTRLSVSRTKLDIELLKCTIEAVEDEALKKSKLNAKEKAELASFIYSVKLGTDYTAEKLKRFLEAALTIIEQTGDLEKLSDAQANKVLYAIALHLAKNQ